MDIALIEHTVLACMLVCKPCACTRQHVLAALLLVMLSVVFVVLDCSSLRICLAPFLPSCVPAVLCCADMCRRLVVSPCGSSCCGSSLDHNNPEVAQQAAVGLAE